MLNQKEFINVLVENGINTGSGVSDSFLLPIVEEIANRNDFKYIAACTEEEAIGICSGIKSIENNNTCIFIPSSGIWNIGNIVSSFNLLYQIPVLCVIAWKGDLSSDKSPENVITGLMLHDLLDNLKIYYTYPMDKKKVEYAINIMNEDRKCSAIIVRKNDFK